MFAVHRTVFPFNRQRSLITDIVQSTDNLFETDPAASHTAEIPITAGIAKSGMTSEHTDLLRGITPINIFHMYMEDTVGEVINKIDIIDALITHMARVIIETEGRMIVQCFERFTGRIIGIAHRENDIEDKLIMAPPDKKFTRNEVERAVHFQEQYYDTQIELIE